MLINSFEALAGENADIILAAPTGKAARRMTEQTGRPASTLHSLLGLRADSKTNFSSPVSQDEIVDADLLVIDESSMIDAGLMADLMYRLPERIKVIFVGDIDQLPSVGAGNVLRSLLASQCVPYSILTKVFRQGENSIIPVNSRHIIQGDTRYAKTARFWSPYFKLFPCDTEEQGQQIIKNLFSGKKAQTMVNDIQVLAPMKNRGATCTTALNLALHDIVNPPAPDKKEAKIGLTLFRVGDKVMQTKNIDGASNGDTGFIVDISGGIDDDGQPDPNAVQIAVQFGKDAPILYDYEGAFELIHATAITIHKSQGSEFPVVIIPLFKSMNFFLTRNLFYTAVTRAKLQLVIVGQLEAMLSAIRREDTSKRNTALAGLIHEEVEKRKNTPSLSSF